MNSYKRPVVFIFVLVLMTALNLQCGLSFSPTQNTPMLETPLFKNVSYQTGMTHNRESFDHTVGIAWGDVNNDGWEDLYITDTGYPNTLYINNGNGTFSVPDIAQSVALPELESGGAVFIDFDNDGWEDLFVVGWGENTLFRNMAGNEFVDITEEAGISKGDKNSKTASWGDYDQDGYLDLYIANWACYPRCGRPSLGEADKLYHNNGDGTFSDATHLLGAKVEGAAFIASFTDYDNDGDLDIYLINDEFIHPVGNVLWRNDGSGCDGWCFTEVSANAGANTSIMGMGLATTDYDNDGDLDYYFSNAGPMTFLQNQGDGTFLDVADDIGVAAHQKISFGIIAFDYDNDGWQDLYVAIPADVGQDNVPANLLFHNEGNGQFAEVCCNSGVADPSMTLGVAYADYNQDGWLDFVIGSFNEGYKLYENQAINEDHHWLSFKLKGSGPINRNAIGTKIFLTSDGITQMQELQAGSSVGSGNELILHFGLGKASRASKIKIVWPNGTTQIFKDVASNQRVILPYPENEGALVAQNEALYGVDGGNQKIISLFIGVLIAGLSYFIFQTFKKKEDTDLS